MQDEEIELIEYFRMYPNKLKKKDEVYVREGKWKCSKSPSGAHHWIVSGGKVEAKVVSYPMHCKYCKEKKTICYGV